MNRFFALAMSAFISATFLASPALAGRIAVAVGGMVSLPQNSFAKVFAELEQAGHEPVNVNDVYRSLHGLVFSLDAQPPNGWPVELASTWTDGIEACRAQAIRPPYSIKNKEAFLCSRELTPWLWQRFLDHIAPARIVIVTLYPKKKGKYSLEAESYGPNETSRRVFARKDVELTAKKIAVLVRKLASGAGSAAPRQVVRHAPAHPRVDSPALFEGEVVEGLAALPVPATCGSLPPIIIEPAAAPLARSIQRLYRTSVPAPTSEERVCAVRVWMSGPISLGEDFATTKMKSIAAALDCGDDYPPVVARTLGISVAQSQKRLTQIATERLLQTLCPSSTKGKTTAP